MEHINESILSDEIKEHQKEARIDHMTYLPGMEALRSDITKQVVEVMQAYDYDSYTAEDVRRALTKRNRTPEDFAALLSPAAEPFIEEMAQCAKVEKENHFGNSVCFFTPLYIANYCENYCIYCGFNCHNRIRRAKLNTEEIEAEMAEIAKSGLQEILILTGESRKMSDVEYIGEACKIARKYFKFSFVPLQTLKNHIRPIMILFASNIAVMVYVYSDTTMLGFMADDYTVGIYAVSSKVYSMMKSVLSAVLVVSVPRLANLYGTRKIAKFKSVVQNITDVIALLLIPSVVGLILQSKNIILFISNEKYLQAVPSLVILSIGLISCMYGWIYNQCVLLPAQKENVILIATIISAIVNVGLNFILIENWREIATAFTTLIAESIMLAICRHESLQICKIKIFNKNLITVGISTVAVICICKIVSLWKLQSTVELFVSVVLSGIGYLVVLLILRNELVIKIMRKLIDVLKMHNW